MQLGNDLFGDGNLGEAFDLFPTQVQQILSVVRKRQ